MYIHNTKVKRYKRIESENNIALLPCRLIITLPSLGTEAIPNSLCILQEHSMHT